MCLLDRATTAADAVVPAPRAMLVFAHPDDEVIALGARLRRFQSALFVHVTDGAPRNEQDSKAYGFASWKEYRKQREEELACALRLAGLNDVRRECLEIPDQKAAFRLSQLVERLSQLFLEHHPEVIFTHPYEGGHPDHDACAFAVHRAVVQLKSTQGKGPMIVEGTFYHSGPGGIETGCFLPPPEPIQEKIYHLSPEEQRIKKALFACFSTQQGVLHHFSTERECFRIAPRYDFHKPPHSGPVFYDQHPWGMNSTRFCELAREAEPQKKRHKPDAIKCT